MAGSSCKDGDAREAGYRSVRIITLGCAKNEVDSEKMRETLRAAGFDVLSDSPREPQGASIAPIDPDCPPDAVVINTCSFITDATQESIDTILNVAGIRDESSWRTGHTSRGFALVVCGCMPSRYGEELKAELPEVDAFLNVSEESRIADVVSELVGSPTSSPMDEAVETSQPWAYVKISDGCSRFCAYCTIPRIRGPYASRTAREILSEIDSLASRGVKEVVLIGQDTGIWGTDFCDDPASFEPLERPSLARLMDRIATDHPKMWIRVMYLQPQGVDDELLDVISSHSNICDYLDIPLQHCDPNVLREMNRSGSTEEYLALIERVREKLGECTVRTTFISGFPGETDEQAAELERFVDEAEFDFAGVFEYSREDGTEAGARDDQVPEDVAAMRAQRVRDIAEEHGFLSAAAKVGREYKVLVCGFEDEWDEPDDDGKCRVWGRTMLQAPDVDSVVSLRVSPEAIGGIVRVRITGTSGYDLEGELLA